MAVNIPVNALVKIDGRRHRADLPPAIRKMAGPHHRRDGRADRHRSRAGHRHHQEIAAPQRQARDRRFRPRLFLAGAAEGAAVRRTQARPRLRHRLRHRQGQCAAVQDRDRPRAQFRQHRRGDRHREGVRCAGAGQHGLRLRPGLPARPADAGGAFHLAVAPARQRRKARQRSRRRRRSRWKSGRPERPAAATCRRSMRPGAAPR